MKHCVPAVFTVQNALEYIWLECVYVRKNELNKLGYLDYYFGKSTFFFFLVMLKDMRGFCKWVALENRNKVILEMPK